MGAKVYFLQVSLLEKKELKCNFYVRREGFWAFEPNFWTKHKGLLKLEAAFMNLNLT